MNRTARKRAEDMSEGWKQWQGRTVNYQYPLQSFLGGSDHSAVFLTAAQDGTKAAIKLIAPASTTFDAQIARWRELRDLEHPNLLRILDSGRCDLDGVRLLYVVMEYADENLSQVLPERALNKEEARATMPSILEGLSAVHAKGLVHGDVKPSNILAIGDQVKLSSDSLTRAGEMKESRGGPYDPPELGTTPSSSATDMWQFGVMLFEVLTQRLPSINRGTLEAPAIPQGVPEPFREIMRNCFQADPAKRWTIKQVGSRLSDTISTDRPLAPVQSISTATTATEPREPAPSQRPAVSDSPKAFAKWPIWAAIAAVVLIAFVLIARPKPSTTRSTQPATETQRGTASASISASAGASRKPQPARPAATTAGSATDSADENLSEGNGHDSASGVVQRSMPKIASSAQRTITGKLKVRVRVNVDASGNVTNTTLTTPGPSKYFARLSEEAAREWKFTAASSGDQSASRQWSLLFAFTRSKIEASAARVDR
jgi:TonB family protein